jgi:hypothetical protein
MALAVMGPVAGTELRSGNDPSRLGATGCTTATKNGRDCSDFVRGFLIAMVATTQIPLVDFRNEYCKLDNPVNREARKNTPTRRQKVSESWTTLNPLNPEDSPIPTCPSVRPLLFSPFQGKNKARKHCGESSGLVYFPSNAGMNSAPEGRLSIRLDVPERLSLKNEDKDMRLRQWWL